MLLLDVVVVGGATRAVGVARAKDALVVVLVAVDSAACGDFVAPPRLQESSRSPNSASKSAIAVVIFGFLF